MYPYNLMQGSTVNDKINQINKALLPVQQLKMDVEYSILLQKFYEGMRTNSAKIFIPADDTDEAVKTMIFLGIEPKDGRLIDYRGRIDSNKKSQWYFTLKNVSPHQLQRCYLSHLDGSSNLCLFFDLNQNRHICFNVDIVRDIFEKFGDNTGIMNESCKRTVEHIRGYLYYCGIETLITPTGNCNGPLCQDTFFRSAS